ncbi:calcium-responsive transcription factor-like [Asterias amurensis]|uniref:calcium-responsive transcription factor-like n=1 Tax=Asterias amurensis TaxID=7602 RepID=UPI003AB221FA
MATIKERFEQLVSAFFENFTFQNGLYRGHVDDKQKLKEFEDNLCQLGLKFSTRTSTYRQERECLSEEEIPTQQVEGESINTSISVNNCTLVQGKTQAPNAEQRLLFHQERGICIPDCGIPFSIIGTTSKQCIYGPHYWAHEVSGHAKQSEGDDGSVRKQRCRLPSKKKGCSSLFNVKCARYYPDFKVDNSSPNLSKWKLRCARHKALNSLRAALEAGNQTLKSYDRFYIEISDISQHNHELKLPDPTRKIHPGLISKIQNLVGEGITEFQEVKCQLADFVTSDILNGCEALPPKSNRSFFPSDLTIRNLIQSALDQEAKQRELTLQDNGAQCRRILEKLTETTHQIKDLKTMQGFLGSLEQLWAEMESKVHLDREMVSVGQSIEESIGHVILSSLASKRQAEEITLIDLPSSKRLDTESVNVYNFYSDMG